MLVQLYPNPVQGRVSLMIADLWLDENPVVTIFSVSGQQIWKGTINQNLTQIDVTSWSNGVYLLQAQSESRLHTKRIVVQH
jgi:hypothetical protein